MSRKWSILAISDIHFEEPDASYLDDAKQLEWPQLREDIFSEFSTALENFPPELRFDLVAVVGDITTHGKPEGFQRFLRDTLPQLRKLVESEAAICVVPGNHDVIWDLDPGGANYFDEKFAPFKDVLSGLTTCLFPSGKLTHDLRPKLKFVPPESGPVYVDPERQILSMCINSSSRCGEFHQKMHADFSEHLKNAHSLNNWAAGDTLRRKYFVRDIAHVTQAQRQWLRKELEKKKRQYSQDWDSYLRVAILHHHLAHHPGQSIEHRAWEFLVDASDVLSLLVEFDFDLVLTGHKHQPYHLLHFDDDKQVLLVGGPTVGGHSAGGSFRGFRSIEVEELGDKRTFKIDDVRTDRGRNALVEVTSMSISPKALLERRSRRMGYSYREVASITLLTPDGDAQRVIECEGFSVQAERDRQEVNLPRASGYLTSLEAGAKDGFQVRIETPIPSGTQPHAHNTRLRFRPPIAPQSPVDYYYAWCALNSFALDKNQFRCMYGDQIPFEFTHFVTEDPIKELTVIVEFPAGFRVDEPLRIRVSRVDPNVEDPRQWQTDTAIRQQLTDLHALRYYESLNIAALRVSTPIPGISYGIEWEVPDAPTGDDSERLRIRELLEQFPVALTRVPHEDVTRVLDQAIQATRNQFASGWSGPIDVAIWLFDGINSLSPLLTALDDGRTGTQRTDFRDKSLKYGSGIAGRALKANRMRVYVAPTDQGAAEPDYYVPIEGLPRHRVVFCLPVHLPVDDQTIGNNARVYERRIPYGVVSFGSGRGDCPLGALRLPENIESALFFQHRMNQSLSTVLQKFLE